MPQTPSVLPASPMRPAALTAIKTPPRASKNATNAFEAVIEEEMRKSTGAAASAKSSSLVSSAEAATPAKKSSPRADDEESDGSETSSGSGANQISQGLLFPAAAIPLIGSSFMTTVDAAQTGSASAQLTPSATANAPSDRRASRIGDSGAAVVSVQTRFAPSDLFSSQIAASSAGGSISISAEAATLSPAQARIASRAEQQSTHPRKDRSPALPIFKPIRQRPRPAVRPADRPNRQKLQHSHRRRPELRPGLSSSPMHPGKDRSPAIPAFRPIRRRRGRQFDRRIDPIGRSCNPLTRAGPNRVQG